MGSGSGVRAGGFPALTPPGVFGDLPVYGKASNRGTRPWLGPVRTASEYSPALETAYYNTLIFF
ncbi:hypothetical protein JP39_11410 [Companilactobacillus heilongjiangensis]|uniref:Uncharacterized protein n=1 Tax=Companilactobacillus heilongjiangensis TaxID=1074467 RepID=A0A0K2LF39_9LACO|nr:hypothetical protein JP39_11410 [Companilactobacillus heilongjiangensis]